MLRAKSSFPVPDSPSRSTGGASRRRHRDRLKHTSDRRTVADDLPLVPKLHHLATQPVVLSAQPHDFERLIDRKLELFGANRLRDVVDGAGFDCRDSVLDAAVPGQHDQRRLISLLSEQGKKLEPREPRHPIIGDDEVHRSMRERLECLRNVVGGHRLVPRAFERILEDQPDRRLVIETEDRCHRMV
jgi:hypothetical protein